MKSDWLNLPNTITLARIATVPFFVWVLLEVSKEDPWRWVAVVLFVAAIATDGVDGAIARARGLVTDLGKLLDPIAVVQSFYPMVEQLARARGRNPDSPPHLRKVTRTA